MVNVFALLLLLLQVQQAEDRAHRIGQTQSVNVHLLLVKDSIDDLMWELLQSKLATTGQVLDGHATRMEVRNKGVRERGGRAAAAGRQVQAALMGVAVGGIRSCDGGKSSRCGRQVEEGQAARMGA